VPARGADLAMELPIGDLRNQRRSGARLGTVIVVKGDSSAQKTGIALTATSLVLATIQRNVAGVYVQGVTLVAGSSGSFTMHLNKRVPPERLSGLVRHQLSPRAPCPGLESGSPRTMGDLSAAARGQARINAGQDALAL
jgi:hypothetical protein